MRFCVLTAFISQLSLAASCESPNLRQLVILELPPPYITMWWWTFRLMPVMLFFCCIFFNHSHLSSIKLSGKEPSLKEALKLTDKDWWMLNTGCVCLRGCVNVSLFFKPVYFCCILTLGDEVPSLRLPSILAYLGPPFQATWDDLGKTVEIKHSSEVSPLKKKKLPSTWQLPDLLNSPLTGF